MDYPAAVTATDAHVYGRMLRFDFATPPFRVLDLVRWQVRLDGKFQPVAPTVTRRCPRRCTRRTTATGT
jgi:hypothetical protein